MAAEYYDSACGKLSQAYENIGSGFQTSFSDDMMLRVSNSNAEASNIGNAVNEITNELLRIEGTIKAYEQVLKMSEEDILSGNYPTDFDCNYSDYGSDGSGDDPDGDGGWQSSDSGYQKVLSARPSSFEQTEERHRTR